MVADRPESHLLQPFWKSGTQFGESLLFVQEKEGERPSAQLLFTPQEMPSLQNAAGEIKYTQGQDYNWEPQSKTLTLPEGSRIPFKTVAELHPPKKSPNSMNTPEDPLRDTLWSEGHFFHDMQVEATYSHAADEWEKEGGYQPTFAGADLPKTVGKLARKEPLNIVMLGDSISQGYNASGFIKVPPMMPPYPELVRRSLEEHYGATVNLTNLSIAGKVSSWGVQQSPAVIVAKPDLVMLAFGMNDSPKVSPNAYSNNVQAIMNNVKAALPDTEFILVSSSLPNPEWQSKKGPMLLNYANKLKALTGPGVAIADVTAVWSQILKQKRYVQISGNGLNHPNDFGHRLYAQLVLGLLVEEPKAKP